MFRRYTRPALHSRHVGARNVWDLIAMLEPEYQPKWPGQHAAGRVPIVEQFHGLSIRAILCVVFPPSRVLWTSPILSGGIA